jgi:hypothetical protein
MTATTTTHAPPEQKVRGKYHPQPKTTSDNARAIPQTTAPPSNSDAPPSTKHHIPKLEETTSSTHHPGNERNVTGNYTKTNAGNCPPRTNNTTPDPAQRQPDPDEIPAPAGDLSHTEGNIPSKAAPSTNNLQGSNTWQQTTTNNTTVESSPISNTLTNCAPPKPESPAPSPAPSPSPTHTQTEPTQTAPTHPINAPVHATTNYNQTANSAAPTP